ncbi:MAG: hypothetical protein AAF849_09600 [Bacteroidota bacterium]
MSKIVKSIGEIDRVLSKEEIEELAIEDAAQITDNESYDLLKIYIEFKRYDTYLQTLIKTLKKATIQQARQQQIEKFNFGNARLSVSARRKYDYSNDPLWNRMKEELEEIKQYKREREQFLKKIKGAFADIVNEQTGEIERVFAPEISYSESITVRL